jgi:pyruvate/2-oxoglutarate/acetoin dehydrogenase E1 component
MVRRIQLPVARPTHQPRRALPLAHARTMTFPLTIRMPYGGGVRAPSWPTTRSRRTTCTRWAEGRDPSTPADAKGAAAAIRNFDPVVVLEPKLHYRTAKEDVPGGSTLSRSGSQDRARGVRPPSRVRRDDARRICRRGRTAGEASCEVLDLRSPKPLDEDGLLASVAKMGRGGQVQEAPASVASGSRGRAARSSSRRSSISAGPVIRVRPARVPTPVLAARGRVHAFRSTGSSTPLAGS